MTVLLLAIFTSISGFFFVGPEHSYSILIPEGTELAQIDTLSETMINHVFVGKDKAKDIDYSLSLSVIESEAKILTAPSTIEQYEKDCSCKVLTTKKVKFTNFRGVKYEIERDIDGTMLGGYVYISEIKNGKSINIVSMALKEVSSQLDKSLTPILNTLVLNF